MIYLAIDPGISSGWSWWEDRRLVECGAGTYPPRSCGVAPSVVVIEKPKIYAARLMKGDPNNIVTLAVQVGRLIERYENLGARVHTVFPNEWKGQVPKEVHHPRIFRALSPAEQDVVGQCGKGLGMKALGDLMDSIGIGQYAIKMGLFT